MYIVYVDRNDRDGAEEEQVILGEFSSQEDALAAARQVVDDYLLRSYQPGILPQELFDAYAMYGEEPWIPGIEFRAWEYAIQRSGEICESGGW